MMHVRHIGQTEKTWVQRSNALVLTMLLALVLALLQLGVPAQSQGAERPLRIMPIGDSITEAKWKTSGKESYRKYLWAELAQRGYTGLDFVGSRHGVLNNPNPPGDWDKDHDGHYGWRADEIVDGRSSDPGAGKLSQWAAAKVPDVALVHIGTNDANQSQSTASTIADINRIIDALRAVNPSVRVVIAKVIPFTKNDIGRAGVIALNEQIPSLAARSTTQSPVVISDMYTGYDPVWNYDKIHPRPSGQAFMADRWSDTLQAYSLLSPVDGQPLNGAPQVSAGADRSITMPTTSVALDGTVTDDGMPTPPGTTTQSWAKASGPGVVTFSEASSADTTATFSTTGTYVLRLTASDGALSSSDEATVTVREQLPEGDRITAGLLALYHFNEGSGSVARDSSGVGSPLDLTITNTSAATWSTGGLSLTSPTELTSQTTATKIINGVMATNAITIEAWVDPANLTQEGPARIVTLSGSTSARNFTLGQGGNYIEARLRTTTTGSNGTSPSTYSPAGSLTGDLVHVVYTRDASGAAKVYLNGELRGTATVDGTIAGSWNTSYALLLGREVGGNRPWLGDYRLVALYSAALSADEVAVNFAQGPDPS